MAIIQEPPIESIRRWRGSETSIDSDLQLEKRLRVMSRGLVEISGGSSKDEKSEDGSALASAGSLNLEIGSSQFVQVIHSSISQHLQSSAQAIRFWRFLVDGHSRILRDCLRYVMLTDLDELVNARQQILRTLPTETSPEKSEASFEEELATVIAHQGRAQNDRSQPLYSSHGPPGSTSGKLTLRTGQLLQSRPDARTLLDAVRGMSKLSLAETPFKTSRSDLRSHVLAWLGDGPGITGQLASLNAKLDLASAPASVQSLEVVRTRVMRAHMALLSYIVTYFWEHALQLQDAKIVPRNLIDSLCEPETWRRWQALDDTVPYFPEHSDAVIQAGCFRRHGLPTWEARAMRTSEVKLPQLESQITAVHSTSWRRRSVTSFSSASSHHSST